MFSCEQVWVSILPRWNNYHPLNFNRNAKYEINRLKDQRKQKKKRDTVFVGFFSVKNSVSKHAISPLKMFTPSLCISSEK